MCFFSFFFNNECMIISSFQEKITTISKRSIFYIWALHYFFNFLCLVMFHESQTWILMVVEKLFVINLVYIDFIQSSSFNCWIKINFDSKWTLNPKFCCCANFKFFLLVFRLAKGWHQDFSLLGTHHFFGTKVVNF
jgi:hypothetical protein